MMSQPVAIPKDSKAVLIAPNYGSAKLRVVVDADVLRDARFASELRELLNTSKAIELTQSTSGSPGAASQWDVSVLRDQFGSIFKDKENTAPSSSGDSTLPAAETEVFYLAGRDGQPMFGFFVKPDDARGPQKTAEAVEKFARLRALKSLANKATTFKRGFRLTPIRVTGTPSESGFKIEKEELVSTEQLTYPFKVKEYFKFQIENLTGKDMYFTLFDLSTDGAIQILYPPQGANELLRAGDKITPRLLFGTTEPLGLETFKIIATTERTDFSFLTQVGVAKGVSPFEELMDSVLGRRSGVVKVAGQDDWTTAQVDFLISQK
jgi:hypothetical protein